MKHHSAKAQQRGMVTTRLLGCLWKTDNNIRQPLSIMKNVASQ